MAGLGYDLIDNNAKFYEGEAVPLNTTKTSSSVDTGTGGQNGGLAVRCRVGDTLISIADTKTLSVKVQDSADDSTFADVDTFFSVTASGGAETWAVNELVAEFILPSTIRRYIKFAITTDDAAAAGKFDAYINYPAR